MTGQRYRRVQARAVATASAATPHATATTPAWRGAALPLALLAAWILTVDTGWVTNPLLVPLAQVLSAPFTDPDGREIWIYGERVKDVTTHPAFRNTVRMIARL